MSTLFILDNKQSNQINLKLLRYIYNNLDTIHVKVKKVDRNIMEVLKKNKITRLPVLIVKNNTYIGLSEIMNYCEKLKKDNSLGFNNSNTLEKYYEEELKSNEEETSLGEEIKKNTRNNGNVNGNAKSNNTFSNNAKSNNTFSNNGNNGNNTFSNNGNNTFSNNGNDNITKSNNKKEIQDDEDSKDDMMINAYLTNMHLSMN